uniref:NACHT domain-containing protein n=1 Tax=Branchiostoma floridae TaxID=7739 RepID=C3YV28_BRAFL|eukprot:XP_002599879.1 hypothetical protein BRAFLDRAFT_95569 [Branchiostoma floridae]
MRPLPWCEDLNLPLREVYTNLQYQRRDDRGHFKDTGMIVSLEDIYKTSKGQAKNDDARSGVRRIRVEGDPGIGKSCSCQKLAHDWSSGKLDDFKAVLFLEMRHMSGKVKDAIFEQLLPEDTNMTQDQLWSYIQENQDDVLFILDGLDELSQTAREVTDVMALIQGKILRNCHVLVTSRPYHCVKDLEKCHEFYKIVGYSIKNSFEFIQKYFSKTPETATKLSDQLFRHQNLSRIAVNPLNNVLICIVWEDNVNEGRVPTSPAELYEMIVYSVAKRYCAKKDIQLEGDRFPTNVEQALRCLRKLSWEGLQQDQLQFNIDDIKEKFGHNADDMLAIGLLTRDNSFSRIKRTHFCAFLHKTFQEYLAAYYVSEWVKQESTSKAGIEYLRSLFGMTKATACNVDIELMSANRERYREVQNMLLSVLGDSSGLLFELFAEELSKDGCKEDKNLLSFFCITFLGRTCEAGKAEFRLAEIVAPCLPQHITNDVWGHAACNSFKFDHVEWIDGLTQVIRCQRKVAMSPNVRLIQHVTIIELILSSGLNLLKELSEMQSLKHINLCIGCASAPDFSHYDSMLADMIMKLRYLRSLGVKIGHWFGESKEARGFGKLTATLQSISEHTTLEIVQLHHPIINWFMDFSADKGDKKLVTFDVDAMVHKLKECVTKNKVLTRLRLSWKIGENYVSIPSPPTAYKGICSSQALSDLCLAIQGNRTLETLTIDGMFSESEGHQEIIDQLMRNKPANFEELGIIMFNSEQYSQRIFSSNIDSIQAY